MEKKLAKALPKAPGVYYFKDHASSVIYVGKAKCLKSRVSSYFVTRGDLKTDLLLQEYDHIDYIVTNSETEALLLEAQMIKEHQPKYNVLLKHGQPFLYLMFTSARGSSLPELKIVRNKKHKGTYFGPFLHKKEARSVAYYLTETFKLTICNKKIENGCLDFHLGRCAGTCKSDFDTNEYLFRINLAISALKNNKRESKKDLQERIALCNAEMKFEESLRLNTYLHNLDVIFETLRTKYTEKKFHDDIFVATTPTPHDDRTQVGNLLSAFLGISHEITTIDCFDISHFQSSSIVGSCVRFAGGQPYKDKFRRFKVKTLTQQNDYAALQEIIERRYKEGDIPDLILIDGGKGQLHAAQAIIPHATIISLAKREERVYAKSMPEGEKLDIHTPVGKLLIALRDYAHHFAISYHRIRRHKEFPNTEKHV